MNQTPEKNKKIDFNKVTVNILLNSYVL